MPAAHASTTWLLCLFYHRIEVDLPFPEDALHTASRAFHDRVAGVEINADVPHTLGKVEGPLGGQATQYLSMTDLAAGIPAFPESSAHIHAAPVMTVS
jgi:hypothetical protein